MYVYASQDDPGIVPVMVEGGVRGKLLTYISGCAPTG